MSKEELIIKKLEKIDGIFNFIILDDKTKVECFKLNDKNNRGVSEVLDRKHTIAFLHDESFRNPSGPIVIDEDGEHIFPPVAFPEVEGENTVSASPGEKIHQYLTELMKKQNMKLKQGDSTLLVGFD